MLNKAILIGRLTKDPELRYTPGSGVAVTTFTLAVNRPFANQKGEREADFIPVVVWRKQAENCANYLGKGQMVAVDGRIQVRSYDDKDGNRRWVTEVVGDNVRFLDKGKDQQQSQQSQKPQQHNNSQDKQDDFGGFEGEEINISEEDVPF